MCGFEDVLDEFRALSWTAENVRLGRGALGRGLFPADPAKPVVLRVPENLLLDAHDAVFEGGRFRVGAAAKIGARAMSFCFGLRALL